MPSGRDQVAYDDIDYTAITVKIDNSTITYDATHANGSSQVGLAVTWSANDTVALTQDGNHVAGKLLRVEADNFGLMQVDGFATLPAGSGATVTRGKAIVGALGAASARGYIREVATATAAELGVQRGWIVNNADTTAVVVDLG